MGQMNRQEVFEIIAKLLPEVQLHSRFLYPAVDESDRSYIGARLVFDTLRTASDPPITEDDFNAFADNFRPYDSPRFDCGEFNPERTMICTQPFGHLGPHVAHGTSQQELERWEAQS